MYIFYSFLLTVGFLLMTPLFLLRREKYAAGFKQRLGDYPEFRIDGRAVVWLHCVSVGETNAARPLVDEIVANYPQHRLIVSTTTKTGQELASKIYSGKAEAIVYFPFDWEFSVRKALRNYRPNVILLMETEIWPRYIHEAKRSGAKVAIVNGRLSEKSAGRYAIVSPIVRKVFEEVDLAAVQTETDGQRFESLGLSQERIVVTGNLKFDLSLDETDASVTSMLATRFDLLTSETDGEFGQRPLIIAASTHEGEERWMLEAYCSAAAESDLKPRLMIAPRHPARFESVSNLIEDFKKDAACEWRNYTAARRSEAARVIDADADIILLDSIGELRAAYPLAEIVFVGGSLIPHGGQSVLEPAAAGKAIITGHHTHNFKDAVETFLKSEAVIQLPEKNGEQIVDELFDAITDLLEDASARRTLGQNAAAVMKKNRGATWRTMRVLDSILRPSGSSGR